MPCPKRRREVPGETIFPTTQKTKALTMNYLLITMGALMLICVFTFFLVMHWPRKRNVIIAFLSLMASYVFTCCMAGTNDPDFGILSVVFLLIGAFFLSAMGHRQPKSHTRLIKENQRWLTEDQVESTLREQLAPKPKGH